MYLIWEHCFCYLLVKHYSRVAAVWVGRRYRQGDIWSHHRILWPPFWLCLEPIAVNDLDVDSSGSGRDKLGKVSHRIKDRLLIKLATRWVDYDSRVYGDVGSRTSFCAQCQVPVCKSTGPVIEILKYSNLFSLNYEAFLLKTIIVETSILIILKLFYPINLKNLKTIFQFLILL